MRESDRSTGSRGRGIGILVGIGKKGNIPSFDEGSPNGAPVKRMPGGLRVVFRGASARKPIRLLLDEKSAVPPCEFDAGTFRNTDLMCGVTAVTGHREHGATG